MDMIRTTRVTHTYPHFDIARVYTGKQFNHALRGETCYKILYNEDWKHYGHTYELGPNVDKNPFQPWDTCSAGGLYFITKDGLMHIEDWITMFDGSFRDRPRYYIGEVVIPRTNDTKVYVEKHKFKATNFELLNVIDFFLDDYLAVNEIISILQRSLRILWVVRRTWMITHLDRLFREVSTAIVVYLPSEHLTPAWCEYYVMTYTQPIPPDDTITTHRAFVQKYHHDDSDVPLLYVPYTMITLEMIQHTVLCGYMIIDSNNIVIPSPLVEPYLVWLIDSVTHVLDGDYEPTRNAEWESRILCITLTDELLHYHNTCDSNLSSAPKYIKDKITQRHWWMAIKHHGGVYYVMPQHYMSKRNNRWINVALRTDPSLLTSMRACDRTHSRCMALVRYNGSLISHVPAHICDMEIINAAVMNTTDAIRVINESTSIHIRNKLSTDLCMRSVTHCEKSPLMQHIPLQFRTLDMWMTCITRAPHNITYLRHVSDWSWCPDKQAHMNQQADLWGAQLWEHAIMQMPEYIHMLPFDYRSDELYIKAAAKDETLLCKVKDVKKREQYRAAARKLNQQSNAPTDK